MAIDKLVQRNVSTLAPSATCAEAARTMRDEGVGAVVVSVDNRPRGIVTDRDLAVRVMAEDMNPQEVTVGEIMSGTPIYLSKKRPLSELIDMMRLTKVRRVMVVDDQGFLMGLVSIDDLLVMLADQFHDLSDVVRVSLEDSLRHFPQEEPATYRRSRTGTSG